MLTLCLQKVTFSTRDMCLRIKLAPTGQHSTNDIVIPQSFSKRFFDVPVSYITDTSSDDN